MWCLREFLKVCTLVASVDSNCFFFFFFYSLLTAAFISFMQREFTVNAGGFNYAYIGFI